MALRTKTQTYIGTAGSRDDSWEYFEFSGQTSPFFKPLGEDGTFELFVKVSTGAGLPHDGCCWLIIIKACSTHVPLVFNAEIDGVPAFRTGDIICQHPSDPKKYKIFGRADDWIILTNAWKVCSTVPPLTSTNGLIDSIDIYSRLVLSPLVRVALL